MQVVAPSSLEHTQARLRGTPAHVSSNWSAPGDG
jgi:hypothetical protein